MGGTRIHSWRHAIWALGLALALALGTGTAVADDPVPAAHGADTHAADAHAGDPDAAEPHAADAHGTDPHHGTDAHGETGHGDGGHGDGAHGGDHSGGMPQLNPESFPGQIFWLAVCFVTLYFLMSGVALPRVTEVIEIRESRIAHDIDRADELKNEAEALAVKTEAALAEARGQAQTLLRQVIEEVEAHRAQRLAQVEADVAARLSAAETRIDQARRDAIGRIGAAAEELTGELTARLTGQRPHPVNIANAVAAVTGGKS